MIHEVEPGSTVVFAVVDQQALNQVMVKLDQIEDDIFNSQLSDTDLNELNDLIQVTKEQLENDPKRVEGL